MGDSPSSLDKAYAALVASGTPVPESPKAHVTDPLRRFTDLMSGEISAPARSHREIVA
jgi:hypothetical protein